MSSKKLLVIIPDGVSLRNFVYSQFPKEVNNAGWDLIFLNMTSLDLKELGLRDIKLKPQPSFLTDLYKRAKINIELDLFKIKFNDPVFDKYKFPPSKKGIKNKVKNLFVDYLGRKYNSDKGLVKIREKIKESERSTDYYGSCQEILRSEKPDMVFCTNQRPVNAISPIIAAQDLCIPTSCFIFSWDNLPKATKVLEPDYYLVWSEYMKDELLKYYPHIGSDHIKITGTPQFEIHFDRSEVLNKDEFFLRYGLDLSKKYLCFSGDDITTSPHDEIFLNDVAQEVEKLNQKGANLGIIFRRCPVDFSDRYDDVLAKYEKLIVSIDPAWTNKGSHWNESIPKKEDLILQTNIIEHSFMVINVGSSMVFDFVAKGKPSAYINYLPTVKELKKDIREVYSYTHFGSMPSKESVYWINEKSDIGASIESALGNPQNIVNNAKEWFCKINNISVDGSSVQVVRQLDSIL